MAKSKKNKTYHVNLRYGFTVCVVVDAKSEEEAIRLAKEQCDNDAGLLTGIMNDELELIDAKA